MTKEKLKKEAEELYEDWYAHKLGAISIVDVICKMAEPREKQIEIDAEQNGELTDKVRELEEKLKKETAQRIHNFNKSIEWKEKHRELEAQIEKMKSDVIKSFGSEYNVLVAKLLKEWEIKEK